MSKGVFRFKELRNIVNFDQVLVTCIVTCETNGRQVINDYYPRYDIDDGGNIVYVDTL